MSEGKRQHQATYPPLTAAQKRAGAHWHEQRERDEQIWALERAGVPHTLGEPSEPDPNAPQPTRAEREAATHAELEAMRDDPNVSMREYLSRVSPGDVGRETYAWLDRREARKAAAAQQAAAVPQVDPAADRRAQLEARHAELSAAHRGRSWPGNSWFTSPQRVELEDIERELFA